MQKINRYIRKISFLSAFLILSLALIGYYFLFDWLYLYWKEFDIIFEEEPYSHHKTFLGLFWGAVVIAPLLETLISQVAVFHLLRLISWLRKRECYIVIIGGILFGIIHFSSLSHIIATTFLGIFLMYVYAIRRRKGGYWIVVLLHAYWNGMVLLLDKFSAEPVFVF
ncbi:MAG: CPBP family intramembrane metalloprotease [Dysgonamonadaceae bacterium]|jgi:hypothetical protein|nr:CPBP family intramembrane metalloprotease [Dysgonamonadaceae bacterium]